MNYFLNEYSTIITIILTLLTTIIFYRIVRFLYNLIKYIFLTNKYKVKYDKETRKELKKYSGSADEIKERNREEEQKLIKETRKLNQTYELTNIEQDRQIVGIAEPKGIWTKFVTEQKMSWIRAMIGTKADSDNFWRNMINAQSKSQSKQQSRSR